MDDLFSFATTPDHRNVALVSTSVSYYTAVDGSIEYFSDGMIVLLWR